MRSCARLRFAMLALAIAASGVGTAAVETVANASGAASRSPTLVTGASLLATQSQPSIAVDASGSVLVAGYTDAHAFPDPSNPDQNTLSVSGVARSVDGGSTWATVNEGPGGLGVLPTVTGGSVYGTPSLAYDPTRDKFVYASIYVRPSDHVQGAAISTSTGGVGWTTPIQVSPTFIANHSADRPNLAVNPATGRLLVTWTDFGTTSTAILSAYSDDLGVTWSTPATLEVTSPSQVGIQAPAAAFLPGAANASSTAYVVWRRLPTSSSRNIGAVRSTDGGVTWSVAAALDSANYLAEDLVAGVDRSNNSPAIDVDRTSGRVYVVYQRNDATGTGDIALRTWTGAPSAGTPIDLSADPGNDRAQFFPSVAVDQSTHRVHVAWYDQAAAATGDLTEVMHTTSADSGGSWTPPTAVTQQPFHAGYGNDTGQPNLESISTSAASGAFHVLYGGTSVQPTFDEGLPALTLMSPDMYYARIIDTDTRAPVRISAIGATDTGPGATNGALDPGETGSLSLALSSYVTNATTGAASVTGIIGTLTSLTAGVTVTQAVSSYPDAAVGATVANSTPFTFSVSSDFAPGTPIDFRLDVASAQGSALRLFRVRSGTTGTPVSLIDENFESSVVPALPTGWSSATGAGTADPWTTTNSFTPLSGKAAFHDNDGTATEWMRLFSPVVAVPSVSSGSQSYVTLDFDLICRLQDEPTQLHTAYDGLTVRLTDQTPGAPTRSVLAEAFAESIKTGSADGFPKHLPRNSSANYFQDMSVWSGDSNGVVHVAMRFPGSGLSGRNIQVRFEYTEDASGTCTTAGIAGACGVAVDNVKLQQYTYPTATTTSLVASPTSPVAHATSSTLTATVSPALSGTMQFFDNGTAISAQLPVSSGTAQTMITPSDGSHSFSASFTPSGPDVLGSSSASLPYLVDAVAPTVQITAQPTDPSSSRAAHFAFTGSDAGSPPVTFSCQLDGATPASCTSPVDLSNVSDGFHTFNVLAADGVGNTSIASAGWHVDGTAPTVQLTSTPPALTASRAAHFEFTASDSGGPVSVTCALDAGSPTACSSSQDVTALADGAHSFTVTATDALGNASNAVASWTVDGTAPAVQMTSNPASVTKVAAGHFAFSTSDASAVSLACSVDGALPAGCGTTFDTPALADGPHQLAVTATDAAGNASSASYSWTVDTVAPVVTLQAPTAPFVLLAKTTLAWSASDAQTGVASYELSTQRASWNGGFGAWSTPTAWRSLTDRSLSAVLAAGYTTCWRLRAVDRAGNVSAWTAARCAARPLDDRALAKSSGWSRKTASGFYLGTFTVASKSGSTLTRTAAQLDRLAVVATTCSTCGVIAVLAGGKRIAKLDLHSSKTRHEVLIVLPRMSQRTTTLAIKVLSAGKIVQVDGLGVSRA